MKIKTVILSPIRKSLMLTSFLVVLSSPVMALESFSGKVTMLEPTYLPNLVVFSMDIGNTTCPAGKLLKWNKSDKDNNKLVYSTLMTALVSGKKVRFYLNDGDTTCHGRYIHLINS